MGKTSKNRRRPDNPYAVEGHHLPQGGFVPQGAVTGQTLVDSSPQGTVGASLSSSPPPSSVGSVISIPDESPTTPQAFASSLNSSHFSSDTSLPLDGISSIQTASVAAVAANINTSANAPSLSPGVSGGAKSAFTAWFITEVMAMMHGLGDVKKPLPESAAIVEELVHQQMVSFVLQALEIAQLRNAGVTSQRLDAEDCLFLLRKNKIKLKRLYKFVLINELKEKANSNAFDPEEEASKEGEAPSRNKLKTVLKNFVRSIDDSTHSLMSFLDDDEDLDDIDDDEYVDAVKMERLRRAELQSRRMTVQQYMEFSGARGVSFAKGAKVKNKVKDWLFLGSRHLNHLDVKVDSKALDIICYLAKETVAEVVDLSILVQQESLVQIEDPTTHVRGIPINKKLENPFSSSSSSSGNSWDGVSIPGLGNNDDKPLGESRGPLLPWHIREAVSRYFDNGFSPFAVRRKNVDHARKGRVLLCV